MNKSLSITMIALFLNGWCGADVLHRRQILSIRWGSGTGEVGRDLAKGPDDTNAGPVDFYVDATGEITIGDLFNHRVVVFGLDGKYSRQVQLPGGKDDTVESVSFDGQNTIALDLEGAGKPNSHVLAWTRAGKPTGDIALKPLGIGLPLYLERNSQGDLFIQDNMTFTTWRLDAAGRVQGKTPDDERIMTLVSQGLYRFDEKGGKVQVLSPDGRLLTTYWGKKGYLQILGVDQKGNLYVLYEKEHGNYGFDKLSPEGQKLASAEISDAMDKVLLDPDRFTSFRPGRIGADGTFYIMAEPTESTFKIFAYALQEAH